MVALNGSTRVTATETTQEEDHMVRSTKKVKTRGDAPVFPTDMDMEATKAN